MEMEPQESDEFVELVQVQGDFEAHVLRGLLESEGIDAIIRSEIVHTVHPVTVNGLGVVRVCVRQRDLDRAQAVLEEYRRRE